MAEHMEPGFHADHSSTQFWIACRARVLIWAQIENTIWRSVSNQYVGILGNAGINANPVGSITSSERATIVGREGRSPNLYPLNLNAFVDEEDAVGDHPPQLGIGFQDELVVTRDDDLVSVRQLAEPGIEIFDCLRALAPKREISRMDEHVAGRNDQIAMELVCIRNADDLHVSPFLLSYAWGIESRKTAVQGASRIRFAQCPDRLKQFIRGDVIGLALESRLRSKNYNFA